jgi:gluconokinase
MKRKIVIVMGVSGSGKTTVAEKLAAIHHAKFIDADDLHPRRNVEKMSQMIALDDDDRQPWLERVADAIYSLQHRHLSAFIACSALKKKYRDQFRSENADLRFLFLDGTYEVFLKRLNARAGHYMSSSMLQSQFETLECPVNESDVLTINANQTIEQIVDDAAVILGLK